jgi:hypothetical protein
VTKASFYSDLLSCISLMLTKPCFLSGSFGGQGITMTSTDFGKHRAGRGRCFFYNSIYMNVFIDTNTILHFKALDQFDWKGLVGTDKIKLLIAPVVVQELDKHRRHSNSRIAQVAKAFSKKITELPGGTGSLNNKIELHTILKRPPNEIFADHSLDKSEQDDRLIASILYFGEPTATLVTNDSLLKLKAESFGISTFMAPDEYEIAPDDDETAKELRKTKQDLARFQNAAPKLNFTFNNGKQHNKFIVDDELDFNALKKKLLEEQSQIYPRWQTSNKLADSEINRYNRGVETYLIDYSNYLDSHTKWFMEVSLSIELQFVLHNNGSKPADAIDIYVSFPNTVLIRNKVDSLDAGQMIPPVPPRPPGELTPQRPSRPKYLEGLQVSTDIFNSDHAVIERENEMIVARYYEKTLKHHDKYTTDPLYLTFPSWHAIRNLSIDYRITAGNIIDPIIGQLSIIVDKTDAQK